MWLEEEQIFGRFPRLARHAASGTTSLSKLRYLRRDATGERREEREAPAALAAHVDRACLATRREARADQEGAEPLGEGAGFGSLRPLKGDTFSISPVPLGWNMGNAAPNHPYSRKHQLLPVPPLMLPAPLNASAPPPPPPPPSVKVWDGRVAWRPGHFSSFYA